MAMQKTLTEITEAEAATRERARVYELLLEEKSLCERGIAVLEPKVANSAGIDALKQIQALCASLPKDCPTSGGRFTPSGYEARDVIQSAAVDALNILSRRRAECADTLEKVRAKLIKNAEKLKPFD
jgi:hypothetical protein